MQNMPPLYIRRAETGYRHRLYLRVLENLLLISPIAATVGAAPRSKYAFHLLQKQLPRKTAPSNSRRFDNLSSIDKQHPAGLPLSATLRETPEIRCRLARR